MNDSSYQPLERRPIKSRNTRWAETVTQVLVRVGISPNAISIIGMLAAIVAGVLFCATAINSGISQRLLWMGGAALCQVRLLCNLFDGMVAVKRGIASPKGELYNEVPDRISDAAVFIGLGYAAGGDVTLGYLAALLSVFVAYVRATAKSAGAPNDFCGPMAKPQRMASVTGVSVYLALMPDSWRGDWYELKIILVMVVAGNVVTAVRRLIRASNYLQGHVK